VAGIAHIDVARVDTDPQVEPQAMLALDRLAERGYPRAHVDGGADGTQAIVLMGDRDAEDRHHRVADELLDRAAVVLDRAASSREVAVEHAPQRLGVERLGELRRLDEVGEEDGDLLEALLGTTGAASGASSAGSWRRIACSSSRSRALGSSPSSSTSVWRACW
jgi:hypothetical protein